jgi:hypothetical protein
MTAKIICEYTVIDDFNFRYNYRVVTGGSSYHLCSVANEKGPVGDNESIEGITRRLLERSDQWNMLSSDGEGNFTTELDIEIDSAEADKIKRLTRSAASI